MVPEKPRRACRLTDRCHQHENENDAPSSALVGWLFDKVFQIHSKATQQGPRTTGELDSHQELLPRITELIHLLRSNPKKLHCFSEAFVQSKVNRSPEQYSCCANTGGADPPGGHWPAHQHLMIKKLICSLGNSRQCFCEQPPRF